MHLSSLAILHDNWADLSTWHCDTEIARMPGAGAEESINERIPLVVIMNREIDIHREPMTPFPQKIVA